MKAAVERLERQKVLEPPILAFAFGGTIPPYVWIARAASPAAITELEAALPP